MGNSLKEYAEVFKELGLTELVLEEGNLKLILKKESSLTQQNNDGYRTSSSGKEQFAKQNNNSEIDLSRNESDDSLLERGGERKTQGTPVKSPLLGVFYGSVNDKVLKAGDKVKSGDTLCTLEAMKMMNDVKSPVDGVIKEVCAKEGDLVEYDQVLFIIGDIS